MKINSAVRGIKYLRVIYSSMIKCDEIKSSKTHVSRKFNNKAIK